MKTAQIRNDLKSYKIPDVHNGNFYSESELKGAELINQSDDGTAVLMLADGRFITVYSIDLEFD